VLMGFTNLHDQLGQAARCRPARQRRAGGHRRRSAARRCHRSLRARVSSARGRATCRRARQADDRRHGSAAEPAARRRTDQLSAQFTATIRTLSAARCRPRRSTRRRRRRRRRARGEVPEAARGERLQPGVAGPDATCAALLTLATDVQAPRPTPATRRGTRTA
jgi:hypothetical protein